MLVQSSKTTAKFHDSQTLSWQKDSLSVWLHRVQSSMGHKGKHHRHTQREQTTEQMLSQSGPSKRAASQSPELANQAKKLTKKMTDKLLGAAAEEKEETDESHTSDSDSDSSYEDTETEQLQEAITSKMEQLVLLKAQGSKQRHHATKPKSPKSVTAKQPDLGELAKDIFVEMKPMIENAIRETIKDEVKKALKAEVKKMKKSLEAERERQNQYLQQQVLRARYERDDLEQHGRKGSVRIVGVREETDENAIEQVQKVAEAAGITIGSDDISACHRLGPKRDGARPIICKFVSRQTKARLMKDRKNLKGKEGFERVYVNEDLTQLRKRLLDVVKRCPRVSRSSTKDGKIFCNLRDSRPTDRPVIVQSPDDLFKLGFEDVPYEELGLTSLLLPQHTEVVE